MSNENGDALISVRVDLLRAAGLHLQDYVQHSHIMNRMNYSKCLAEHTRKMLEEAVDGKHQAEVS